MSIVPDGAAVGIIVGSNEGVIVGIDGTTEGLIVGIDGTTVGTAIDHVNQMLWNVSIKR